jgi:hypothetical protein
MAKAKKEPQVEAPVAKEAPSVPNKQNGTGKFVVANFGGQFFVYSPEGVRISSGSGELEATDLATKFQSFHK